MKIAYFHCFAGISGDMILGALVDLGLDWEQLQKDLAGLSLTGYQLRAEKVLKQGIGGTKVHVTVEEEHVDRHLADIVGLIGRSALPCEVKDTSIAIFTRLAEAEAKVHQSSIQRVNFHEIGAVDAIINIVGSVIGLWRLGVQEVYSSPIQTGTGLVEGAHGLKPIPSPATMELLKSVPIYSRSIEKELVTPTGAAIITTYCRNFGDVPPMRIVATGYGAGTHDLTIPNVLRLTVGEEAKHSVQGDDHKHLSFPGHGDVNQGQAVMMEVNIDDMNPEFYDYIIIRMFKAGALDVFLQKIQMKKNRPGVTLSLLIHAHQVEQFYGLIFAETTSIGVRVYPVTKYMLPYKLVEVETELGLAKVKVARYQNELYNLAPEYEDCRRIAEERQVPLKRVYELVKYEGYRQLKKNTDKGKIT